MVDPMKDTVWEGTFEGTVEQNSQGVYVLQDVRGIRRTFASRVELQGAHFVGRRVRIVVSIQPCDVSD
jgi:hypothetical protein